MLTKAARAAVLRTLGIPSDHSIVADDYEGYPPDPPEDLDAGLIPSTLIPGTTITHFALLDAQGNILVKQPISMVAPASGGEIIFTDIKIVVT